MWTEHAAVTKQLMAALATVTIATNVTVILKVKNAQIAKKLIRIAMTAPNATRTIMTALLKKQLFAIVADAADLK